MASVEAALAWAARGFRVFPLIPFDKRPAVASFEEVATTDAERIRAWWADGRDYNVGVLTNDMIVVDLDTKYGPHVTKLYEEDFGGDYNTLTVRTPTGGLHLYFKGPDSRQRVGLRPNIDIRSHNGYVVAPGSFVIDATKGVAGEYVIERDVPLAPVPELIQAEMQAPNTRRERTVSVELDTPVAIARALDWLARAAPIAIEGQGGDNTTYNVACKLVRDYALTAETAWRLMWDAWNPRCYPPWDADGLWRKVENADEYAAGSTGSALPEAHFGTALMSVPAPPSLADKAAEVTTDTWGNVRDIAVVPARPWLVPNFLMRGAITLIPGEGGAGKSVLSLTVAAHLAVGKPFAGYAAPEPTRSLVYNAEDDADEQSRRLWAVCNACNLDFEAVRQMVRILDKSVLPLELATRLNGAPSTNYAHASYLEALCNVENVGLLALDPLVELHTLNENDNAEMRYVMDIIRGIGQRSHTATLLTHHTPKSALDRDGKSKPVVARGATSIPNASRIVLTLAQMTDEEREKYGVHDTERYKYVQLVDAKGNYQGTKGNGAWFEWTGVIVPSRDHVGVLRPFNVETRTDKAKHDLAVALHECITSTNSGRVSVMYAVEWLKNNDELYRGVHKNTLRSRIERAFAKPFVLSQNATIVVQTEQHGERYAAYVRFL